MLGEAAEVMSFEISIILQLYSLLRQCRLNFRCSLSEGGSKH